MLLFLGRKSYPTSGSSCARYHSCCALTFSRWTFCDLTSRKVSHRPPFSGRQTGCLKLLSRHSGSDENAGMLLGIASTVNQSHSSSSDCSSRSLGIYPGALTVSERELGYIIVKLEHERLQSDCLECTVCVPVFSLVRICCTT